MVSICLSFDDGRMDQFINAFHILSKYDLVGTFHITSGYIDGTFNPDHFIGSPAPMKVENVLEIYESGMEISSHGDMHILEPNDYFRSLQKFNNWGIDVDKCGISIPESSYDEKRLQTFINETKSTLEYVRVGRSKKCYSLINKIRYVLYSLIKCNCCYLKFNQNNVINTIDKNKIVSLVVKKNTGVKNLIRFIEKNKSSNGLIVIMLHSIVEKPSTQWEWSIEQFELLCDFLSNSSEIKVDTLKHFVQNIG